MTDAASDQNTSRPTRRARWLRRAPWFALGLTLLPLLPLIWLMATTSGLRAGAALIETLSGNALHLQGAQGHLLGQFGFAQIAYADADQRIDLQDLRVVWHPAALLTARIDIASASLARLDIARRPDPHAPPPSDLRLPLPASWSLALTHVDIADLRVRAWQAAPGLEPITLFEVRDLAARLASDGRIHQLADVAATTPFGHVTGGAQLDGVAPFLTRAQFDLHGTRDGKTYSVALKADGSLRDALNVDLHASGEQLQGEARLVVAAFEPVPLRDAKIDLGLIDPAAFVDGAPHAGLQLHAELHADATRGGEAAWRLTGPVDVSNNVPGPLDKQALPLSRLHAQAVWQADSLVLENLQLTLNGKGAASGRAVLRDRKLDMQLKLAGVDPQTLATTLKATRVDGNVHLLASETEQALTADFRERAARGHASWHGEIDASHRDGVIELRRARLDADGGVLSAHGKLALTGARSFTLDGQLKNFDPARYADLPKAVLNADFNAHGNLTPRAGSLQFDLRDSHIVTHAGPRPLSGRASLRLEADRLAQADLAFDLAGNRFDAKGTLGRPGDHLEVHIAAPHLDRLGAVYGLGGQLDAQAQLGGRISAPSVDLKASAAALRFAGWQLDTLDAQGQLGEGEQGRFAGTLKAGGLRRSAAAPAVLTQLTAQVDGTRGRHTLQIMANLGNVAGELSHSTLALKASGALSSGPAWRGTLDQLSWQGESRGGKARAPLALAAPTSLALSAQEAVLGAAELRTASSRLRLMETRWSHAGWITRGDFSGLRVGLALDAEQRVVARGRTLTLDGDWDVHADTHLNGAINLARQTGDIALAADAPVALGLRDLRLTVRAVDDHVTASFIARGDTFGELSAGGSAHMQRENGAWQVARNAPLLADARLEMTTLAWLGPLLAPGLQLAGSASGEAHLTGSAAAPQVQGTLALRDVEAIQAVQGVHFIDGAAQIAFTQDRATLTRLQFRTEALTRPREPRINKTLARSGGSFSGSGALTLADGVGAFTFNADKLAVLQRADRWLMVSGDTRLTTTWDSLNVTGKLTADAGYFEFPATPPPTLSDDVVILGREAPAGRTLRVNLDIEADLGDKVYFHGRGIDARLTGALHLRVDDGSPPRLVGTITTRDGSFDAYGQQLAIERGIINFQGPIETAGLNVLALRKGLAVEAGVEVTGTVLKPRVRLVSEPNVPDSEKLSWIVLGRGQDQAGGDAALLLNAASALFGGEGGGVTRQIALGLGLDEFSIGSDAGGAAPTSTVVGTSSAGGTAAAPGLSAQIVTLGKRLSANSYVAYEQGLAGATSVVKLTYTLTRRLSIVGRAGTDNSVDLTYSFSFD